MHYLDAFIDPGLELGLVQRVVNDAVQAAHLAAAGRVGLDFPQMDDRLPALSPFGRHLRFFGELPALEAIQSALMVITELVVRTPHPLPKDIAAWVRLEAKIPKKGAAKAAARLAAHLGDRIRTPITLGSSDYVPPDGPFINLHSASNGGHFRAYLTRQSASDPDEGAPRGWSTYGFARPGQEGAQVPVF